MGRINQVDTCSKFSTRRLKQSDLVLFLVCSTDPHDGPPLVQRTRSVRDLPRARIPSSWATGIWTNSNRIPVPLHHWLSLTHATAWGKESPIWAPPRAEKAKHSRKVSKNKRVFEEGVPTGKEELPTDVKTKSSASRNPSAVNTKCSFTQ